jgi:hypothetical protein
LLLKSIIDDFPCFPYHTVNMIERQIASKYIEFGNKYDCHIRDILKLDSGITDVCGEDGTVIPDAALVVIVA